MTYNVFGGTISLTQSINQSTTDTNNDCVYLYEQVTVTRRCQRRAYVRHSCYQSDYSTRGSVTYSRLICSEQDRYSPLNSRDAKLDFLM